MRPSSSIYRFLAALVVTVMTWPVALPVVHLACAMETDVMAVMCEHEDASAAGIASDHDMGAHSLPLSESDLSSEPVSQHDAVACCIVSASMVEDSAIPARVGEDAPRISVVVLAAVHTMAELVPRSFDLACAHQIAPSVPPFSLAFLSVFLI